MVGLSAPALAWWQSIEQVGIPPVVNGMITPIMSFGGNAVGPSASVTNYAPLNNGTGFSFWTSNTTVRQIPIAVSGSISGLYANFPVSVVASFYTLTLMKNGSGTALTCSVGVGQASSTVCQDTTDSVSVAAGDLLQWQLTPNAAATAETQLQISALFTSAVGQESPLIGAAATTPASNSANQNIGLTDCAWVAQASEVNISSMVPAAGTISNLYIWGSTAPGAAKTFVYTLWKNGAATSMTVTLTGAGSGAGITTGNNLSNSVAVNAGDTISLNSAPTGTPSTANVGFSMRFVPTTSNQAMLTQVACSVPATSGTKYMNLNGTSLGSGTETTTYNIAPVIPGGKTMTLGNLIAAQDSSPSTNRTVFLRSGGTTNQSPTVAVTSSTTGTIGGVAGVFTLTDSTHTYAPATGTLLDLSTVPVGTQTNALTWYKTGMTVTIQ